jgi:hypothetical protein
MEPTPLGRELLALCDEVFEAVERFGGRRESLRGEGGEPGRIAPVAEVSSGA